MRAPASSTSPGRLVGETTTVTGAAAGAPLHRDSAAFGGRDSRSTEDSIERISTRDSRDSPLKKVPTFPNNTPFEPLNAGGRRVSCFVFEECLVLSFHSLAKLRALARPVVPSGRPFTTFAPGRLRTRAPVLGLAASAPPWSSFAPSRRRRRPRNSSPASPATRAAPSRVPGASPRASASSASAPPRPAAPPPAPRAVSSPPPTSASSCPRARRRSP